jgi:hypothetical protein
MIVAAPLANLVIRRLGGNADRQEVGGRLNLRPLTRVDPGLSCV